MMEFTIQLAYVPEIKRFIRIASTQDFDIIIISGRQVINAKSIMNVFTLDLAKPLRVEADCCEAECEDFIDAIREFIVEDIPEQKNI